MHLALKTLSLSLVFFFMACDSSEPVDADRGSIAKADLVGSCEDSCDGPSASGTCWCDDSCADYGDCCSDKADHCEAEGCEACLASGGTWQPEANACTDNCDLQDISCFTDSCPAPSDCEACLASGGTWQPEANACTANCDLQDISCFTDSCPAE